MGRVVAWAPNPRYGLSPRRLTGPAFALDSCRSKPSLGTLLELLEKDEGLDASAPAVLCKALCFSSRGGLLVGRIIGSFVGLTNM